MFVDDLHIFANSILGLTTIISTIIKQALQEDIIINMDKSAIYLHISKCPLLKHLKIKKGGVFLGAQTSQTFHHIKSRIGQAKAAHAEMMLRGFSQKHLGRRTITKNTKTTRHHSKHPTWNLYEHLHPKSSEGTKYLYTKAKNSKRIFLKEFYETLPNNFLSKEVNMIESTWGFDSNQIIQQYKGEKNNPETDHRIPAA
jgi:hypothetical protein